MTEREHRQLIVDLAREWKGTRYLSNAMIKGPRGGVDCAMLLVAVYADAGIVSKDFDPRPYPPQWHMHRGEEQYLNTVLAKSHEISSDPGPGDVVLFKIGRLFAHGAIVSAWPRVIHARAPMPVIEEDISKMTTGKHALVNVARRFFSFWGQ